MSKNFLVSVIIPTYNSAKYISEAILSILEQTYENLEVIVVDDGSTDNTKEQLQQYFNKISYYYQPNMGISSALNNAIKMARGDYLSFLDADDLWAPDKISIQMNVIKNNSELKLVFCQMQQFISPELPDEIQRKMVCPKDPMSGYSRSAMLITRKDFDRVGGFSTRYSTGEFMDWYMRSQEYGLKSYVLPDILCRRRIHKTNTTLNNNQLGSNYAQLLKAALDRRREIKKNENS